MRAGHGPTPGDTVGPYQLVASIARGGMGTVFAARSRVKGFDRLVAIKLLHPHFASETRFVEMLLDEARIAAGIDHPNVVRILDVVEHDGVPLVVMELLQGRSLADLVARAPDAPRDVLCAILARVADGLGAAHAAVGSDGAPLGVVHRDVSPHNVHVGFDGRVKLVDFGIAAARGRLASTRTGEVKGKLAYLAPEQITQGTVDGRTDLFALGIVAHESLTGQRLFRQDDDAATMWAVMHREVPRVERDDVPSAVTDVLARCLARPMHERPTSAAEIAVAFREGAGAAGEPGIATFMQSTFAEEMRADAARLEGPAPVDDGAGGTRVATRADGASAFGTTTNGATAVTRVELDATATSATGDVVPSEAAPRTRRGAWIVAALVAAGAVSAGVVALRGSPDAPPASAVGASVRPSAGPTWATSATSITADASSATSVAPNDAAPAGTVTMRVGPRTRLVLVDGKRHDERPIVLELGPAGSASVSLVGADGRIVERAVTAADDGTSVDAVALASPASSTGANSSHRSPPRAAATPAATGAAAASNKPPLWKSPYP